MQTQTPRADACTPTQAPSRAELIAQHQRNTLSHYSEAQRDAALRLYRLVKHHVGTSGGNAAAKLLLGLYNGQRFPFDLTDLRSFDAGNFAAAMTVLHMDARQTWCEIHVLLDAILGRSYGTGPEFEHWAYNLRLKGACKKAALPELPREELAA